jgi:hypothetical protein
MIGSSCLNLVISGKFKAFESGAEDGSKVTALSSLLSVVIRCA